MKEHGHLLIFKEIAERYRAWEAREVYDPYRYAYTIDEKTVEPETGLKLVAKKEYEKIRDFHPFLKSNRGNVYAVPCSYQDKNRNKWTKIYIMGWYFYGKQLKISWKPSHSRKSRWRSSLISVDKTSQRFFFQGELYKKGTFPIFLEDLSFANKSQQQRVDKEYRAFLSIIDQQKQEALLRYK